MTGGTDGATSVCAQFGIGGDEVQLPNEGDGLDESLLAQVVFTQLYLSVQTACDCILHFALPTEDSCGRLSGAHLRCQVKALVDGAFCTDGREV